ncbi:MAG: TonB-dependent receptor [Chitinophagales bacterium]|nr:TonB-dependent receptor [Chitinophagales bacterium]
MWATAVYGQSVVEGRVVSDGKPVMGAYVKLSAKQAALTDSTGYFRLANMSAQKHLHVQAIGFQPATVLLSASQQSYTISLAASEQALQEVVVTGTMKPVLMSASPVTVEQYNSNFFRKSPSMNVFEALSMVNGIRAQYTCNVCNTGEIRINGLEGAHTLVLIDGMPIVSALGSVYGYMGIPNSIIDKVEVMKGPAASLYGSESMAGIVNIITKSPEKAPAISADIQATSFGEHNTDLSFRLGKKKVQTLWGINHFGFNQVMDRNADGFTDMSLQNRISLFNKWSFKRHANRKASIAARYVYEDRWGGQTQWNPSFRGGDSVYGESIYTNRLELLGQYSLPIAREDIQLQFSYNYHGQNSVYGNTPYMGKQHIGFAQLLWNKSLRDHDLLFGGGLRYTWLDDNTLITADANGLNQPSRISLPGLFMQDEWTINDKHTLLGGLRADYHQQHGVILSPRLNYKWSVAEKTTLRAGLGRGFRVVNVFSEDHAALTGARHVVIAESLNPEQSYNINVHLQQHIHTDPVHILLDASAFHTNFSNKIIPDYLTNDNQVIYRNLVGRAVSQGLSLNASLEWRFPLTMNLGITYLDAFQEQTSNNQKEKLPIIQTPKYSATWALTYQWQQPAISVDLTGNYTASMLMPVLENDPRPAMSPAFSLWNLQLTKKWTKFQLYTGVKNLFDYLPLFPIMRPSDPFDKNVNSNFGNALLNPAGLSFDPNYNYAPMQGRRFFVGLRFSLR